MNTNTYGYETSLPKKEKHNHSAIITTLTHRIQYLLHTNVLYINSQCPGVLVMKQ